MTWRIYNVFNEVLLKPYYPPIFPSQKNHNSTEPEEEITDVDDGNYEVEELLDSRISKKGRGQQQLEYLVKWKNYPLKEASWEPKQNLKNAQESIVEFHIKHPGSPRHVRTMPKIQKYENLTEIDVPKSLFGWEDGKFERDYLDRLEKAWERWKGRGHTIQEWEEEEDDIKFTRT